MNTAIVTDVLVGLLIMGISGVVAVVWNGFHGINARLNKINVHLATMNGRLGKTELWQEQHEKQDDERHEEMRQGQRDIWNAMKGNGRS